MGVRLTHDEYVRKLHDINPNVIVVEEYINSKTNILHRCCIDGYEWSAKPSCLLNGTGCPLCAGKVKTTDKFIQEMSLINKNIIIIGEYISAKSKILCECVVDGYRWEATPTTLLRGAGCPLCAGVKKKTTNEYIEAVNMIDPNIIIVGIYINARTPILHKCVIDGYMWMADPHHVLSGRGCPMCKASKGERVISNYLDKKHILFNKQQTFDDCKNIFCLPFDFYLPDYGVCIEYDGRQHFEPIDFFGGESEFQKRRINDDIKTRYCHDNNIPLLRIRYDQDIIDELDKFIT